jgi:DNA-binding NarL/FixJ family response regulator
MSSTVFLADDHAVLRDGVKLLLEMQPDIEVVGEADDGRETVRKVSELKPDVVILDILMPELNGIEATRQILQNVPDTQIIILSAFTDSEHVFRAMQAGAKGYLIKASAGSEVVKAIHTVRSGRRYLSQVISDNLVDAYIRQRESDELDKPLSLLNAREMEVLQLVVEGKANNDIAAILALSPDTIATYRKRIMKKLNIHDLPGLVKFAISHGITTLD